MQETWVADADKIDFVLSSYRSLENKVQQNLGVAVFPKRCSLSQVWFHVHLSGILTNVRSSKTLKPLMIYIWVVVSNIFCFHPHLRKNSNLTNIFQMGWNHQPDIVSVKKGSPAWWKARIIRPAGLRIEIPFDFEISQPCLAWAPSVASLEERKTTGTQSKKHLYMCNNVHNMFFHVFFKICKLNWDTSNIDNESWSRYVWNKYTLSIRTTRITNENYDYLMNGYRWCFPKHKVHGLAGWFDAYFEVRFLGKSWRRNGNCIHIGKLWKLVETAHGNLFLHCL